MFKAAAEPIPLETVASLFQCDKQLGGGLLCSFAGLGIRILQFTSVTSKLRLLFSKTLRFSPPPPAGIYLTSPTDTRPLGVPLPCSPCGDRELTGRWLHRSGTASQRLAPTASTPVAELSAPVRSSFSPV